MDTPDANRVSYQCSACGQRFIGYIGIYVCKGAEQFFVCPDCVVRAAENIHEFYRDHAALKPPRPD
jgi:predicted RNA-binding Zn-ribbon protein involved in translation (DUF1610 family)